MNKHFPRDPRLALLVTLPLLICLHAPGAAAQASDVECDGCVDTRDIAIGAIGRARIADGAVTTTKIAPEAVGTGRLAPGAVTSDRIANRAVKTENLAIGAVRTARIADGAVTADKVEPRLKATLGTACPSGQSVVGIDADGHLVCTAALPLYYPSGPQVDVPETDLVGWSQCYQDTYGDSGPTVASILDQCDGNVLMLACRPVGATSFTLLAAGERADVLFDTGATASTTHTANGTAWYFSDNWSWGFAAEGDSVEKGACDYLTSGANDQRLCWHTYQDNSLIHGWRCGAATGLFDGTWERVIYHANWP